jgi:predicted phage tail protein
MNATQRPERTEFLVKGLQAGQQYRFKLQALNFNGASAMSDVFTFNACLAPSGQPAPYKIATTTTSITIGWNAPFDEGGCPVTGFAVFRDEGDQTTPATEVNVATDAAVRGIPTLR